MKNSAFLNRKKPNSNESLLTVLFCIFVNIINTFFFLEGLSKTKRRNMGDIQTISFSTYWNQVIFERQNSTVEGKVILYRKIVRFK